MTEMTDQLTEPATVDENLRPSVSPSESRFMFVDVAAARAKQLRRGAVVRVSTAHETPKKLERLAMEEVKRGLIEYTVPPLKKPGPPATE